jgi:hypothetical protein
MKLRLLAAATALSIASSGNGAPVPAPAAKLASGLQQFVSVQAGRIALTHVRVIDGTGAAPLEDATILIDGPKIAAVQPAAAAIPSAYRAIDLKGASVLPGLVGMHNHMSYIARPNIDASGHFEDPLVVPQMTFSAPRLYLAGLAKRPEHLQRSRWQTWRPSSLSWSPSSSTAGER